MTPAYVQLRPPEKLRHTWAPERKPVPAIVIVVGEPIGTLVGVMLVIVGSGLGAATVSGSEFEGPPPGVGLETEI